MIISAQRLDFKELNEQVKAIGGDVVIDDVLGQRYIGAGLADKRLTINGTPGNALGAYLDGASIEVNGNAQDAVGNTMNDGRIVVHGNAGDALGYAMRGGQIFVKGNAGYRCGIHMKEYPGKLPVIVIGGSAGSFLGEYQAGGLIVVLGIVWQGGSPLLAPADPAGEAAAAPVGSFTGTGMHGGRIMVRSTAELIDLPEQVSLRQADAQDISLVEPYLAEYARLFGVDVGLLASSRYHLLTPNALNPYKQLYTDN
jgi:glutamate synthase domain-containing protein 3